MKPIVPLYRYDSIGEAPPRLYTFNPIRATACGWWFFDDCREFKDRFVQDGAAQAFAKPDIEAAKQSYLIRRQKYAANCRRRLDTANYTLACAEALVSGEPMPPKPGSEDDFSSILTFTVSPDVNR